MMDIYEEAKTRMPSQKARILQMLTDAGKEGVTNAVLNDVSYRYSDRIHTLKKEGYVITIENLGKGLTLYRLNSEIHNVVDNRTGLEVVTDIIEDNYQGIITSESLKSILQNAGLNIVRKPNVLNKR